MVNKLFLWFLNINKILILVGLSMIVGYYGVIGKLWLYNGSFYNNASWDLIEIILTASGLGACSIIMLKIYFDKLEDKVISYLEKKEAGK